MFEKGRKGIMLCYPFEEKRLLSWKPPWLVQPKLDGERCRAVVTPSGAVLLLSSQENVICSVPHINAALEAARLEIGTELDGELYHHASDFESIRGMVGRTINLHPAFQKMEYHIFDLVDENLPQYERLYRLKMMAAGLSPPLHIVPTRLASTTAEVMAIMEEYVGMGFEGIVVRHIAARYIRRRSTHLMKFKPKKSDEYLITGSMQEVSRDGEPKGTLGALVCQGGDRTKFCVGTGFTQEERQHLWQIRDKLPGLLVRVSYQHLTKANGIPRFPVFCEVLRCPDS